MEKLMELRMYVDALEFAQRNEVCKLIDQIFVCEMNDQKIGKFDLYSLCASGKEPRTCLTGIYHKNGYKYATNAYVLCKTKADYPKELEGRVVLPDGSLLSEEARVYNYDDVVNIDTANYVSVDVDFAKVREFSKEAKQHKKIFKKHSHCFINVYGDTSVNFNTFEKVVNAMQAFGITNILVNPKDRNRMIVANNDTTSIVFLPSAASIDESEQDCIKWFKLNY